MHDEHNQLNRKAEGQGKMKGGAEGMAKGMAEEEVVGKAEWIPEWIPERKADVVVEGIAERVAKGKAGQGQLNIDLVISGLHCLGIKPKGIIADLVNVYGMSYTQAKAEVASRLG